MAIAPHHLVLVELLKIAVVHEARSLGHKLIEQRVGERQLARPRRVLAPQKRRV